VSTVVLVGSLDTKGDEYAYATERIRAFGADTILVDTGTGGPPSIEPDITAEEVAVAAGGTLDEAKRVGRSAVRDLMVKGAIVIVGRLREEGRLDAAFALGGSNNTTLAATAFRTLPVGVPKLILTTMASGNVKHLVGPSDLILAPSVVDIAGLNHVSRPVIANAASAVAGMAMAGPPTASGQGKPVVACSMIGLTSRAVTAARQYLESRGNEVVVFHMTGSGGLAMEALIETGAVNGVLDLTTSEVTDDLFGGVCSAGPGRLRSASKLGVPQIVGLGGLDMINFGPAETLPTRFDGRTVEIYNPSVTLVRVTEKESAEVGRSIVERLGQGAATVLLSTGGLSAIDEPSQGWYDPAANDALCRNIRAAAGHNLRLIEAQGNIDRPEFGLAAAALLQELMTSSSARPAQP
jgi:uncharacterized protein (UPF0261 family)